MDVDVDAEVDEHVGAHDHYHVAGVGAQCP